MTTMTADPEPQTTPGSITIPPRCKPSKVCSTDRTRPVLCHAYLVEHDGALWVCAADGYIAVAVKVDGHAAEGWIPIGALRLMERGQDAEQISPTAWRVQTNEGVITFDIEADVKGATFPDFKGLGVWDKREEGSVDAVGMNTKFMQRIGEAIGAEHGCRFEFIGPLRPIRVTSLGHDGRVALQMPIRLQV